MKTVAIVALAALAVGACKAEIDVSISVADLQRVRANDDGVTATAIVGIETTGCGANGFEVAKAMAAGFGSAEFIGCRESGLDTLADVRVRLPIVTEPENLPAALTLVIANHKLMPHRLVVLMADRDRLQAIEDALPDDMRTAGIGDLAPVVVATIRNDSAAEFSGQTIGAWVDGIPRQLPYDFTLAPRGEIRLRASNVGNYGLFDGATLLFGLLE